MLYARDPGLSNIQNTACGSPLHGRAHKIQQLLDTGARYGNQEYLLKINPRANIEFNLNFWAFSFSFTVNIQISITSIKLSRTLQILFKVYKIFYTLPEVISNLLYNYRTFPSKDIISKLEIKPTVIPSRGGFWLNIVNFGQFNLFREINFDISSVCVNISLYRLSPLFQGCLPRAASIASDYTSVIILVIISLLTLEIIVIILACCLCLLQRYRGNKTFHTVIVKKEAAPAPPPAQRSHNDKNNWHNSPGLLQDADHHKNLIYNDMRNDIMVP